MARKSFYTRDKQEVKAITDQLEEGLKELFATHKGVTALSFVKLCGYWAVRGLLWQIENCHKQNRAELPCSGS